MRPRVPSYRLHRASGQAVVTLSGRDIYLGRHGSQESRDEYARVVAEWLAGGRVLRPQPGVAISIAEMVQLYLAHAQTAMVRDGVLSSQYDRARLALKHLVTLYAETVAAEFSPTRLKAVRSRMVDTGWARTHINKSVQCVIAAFAWACSEELLPADVVVGLRTVEPLQAGRTTAPETRPILPPDEAAVEAVMQAAAPPIRAMIGVQLWTGARPGEVVQMRGDLIDRTGRAVLLGGEIQLDGVWVFQPPQHKTKHRGRPRVILIGPQAQAYLTPLLDSRPPDAPLFSPAETVADLRRRQRAARKTRVQPSQQNRAKTRPQRRPGRQYTTTAYLHYVTRLCRRLGVPHWHPHQLRHLAATRLAAVYGEEVARAILGHRHVDVTRRYVEADLRSAAKAIATHG